jgi:hypothetical protein
MSTDAYIDARAEFVAIDKRAKDLGGVIKKVGESLSSNPILFMFGNAGGVGMTALRPDTTSVNAEDWPSVKEIMDLLNDLHAKRSRMWELWKNLDQPRKAALQAPPS